MVNSFGHKIIVKYSFTEIKCKLSETVICLQLSLLLEERIVLFTFKRNLRVKGEIHKLITTERKQCFLCTEQTIIFVVFVPLQLRS